MRRRWMYLPLILVGIVTGGWGLFHLLLGRIIADQSFKTAAEERVSEFLQAKVKIHAIKLGLTNQVDLSGLEVLSEKVPQLSYRMKVNTIVFRYNFLQVMSRNIKMPSSVVLKDPQLVLDRAEFPYELFQHLNLKSNSPHVSSLQLKSGEIHVPLPDIESDLFFSQIQGSFDIGESQKIQVQFSASVRGLFIGKVEVSGWIDPLRKTHELRVRLMNVDFSDQISVPVHSMQGKIRWVGGRLYMDHIQASMYGWPGAFQGVLDAGSLEPHLTMEFYAGKQLDQMRAKLHVNFNSKKFETRIVIPDSGTHTVWGTMQTKKLGFDFPQLIVDDAYEGKGSIDLKTGELTSEFEKDRQRANLSLNLRENEFKTQLKLDHFHYEGWDVVTSMLIRVEPVAMWGEKNRIWKLKGEFSSDYFILEYTPFENFRGTFEMTSSRIENIKASWNDSFSMAGAFFFKTRVPESDLTVRIKDFDLVTARDLGVKPLPEKTRGKLDGRVKIAGPLKRPTISGAITIRQGGVEDLDYDRASIQFEGIPPYLILKDSHVMKGRSKLSLTGTLDLNLPNIFQEVQLQTPDNLVVWKGFEMSTSDQEGDTEVRTGIKGLPVMELKAGASRAGSGSSSAPEQDENYVAAGPKIKF